MHRPGGSGNTGVKSNSIRHKSCDTFVHVNFSEPLPLHLQIRGYESDTLGLLYKADGALYF